MPFNAQKLKEIYFSKTKSPDRSYRDCHINMTACCPRLTSRLSDGGEREIHCQCAAAN